MNKTLIQAGNNIVKSQPVQNGRGRSYSTQSQNDLEVMKMLAEFQASTVQRTSQFSITQNAQQLPRKKLQTHVEAIEPEIDLLSLAVQQQNQKLAQFMSKLASQESEQKYLNTIDALKNKIETLETKVNKSERNRFNNQNDFQFQNNYLQMQQMKQMMDYQQQQMQAYQNFQQPPHPFNPPNNFPQQQNNLNPFLQQKEPNQQQQQKRERRKRVKSNKKDMREEKKEILLEEEQNKEIKSEKQEEAEPLHELNQKQETYGYEDPVHESQSQLSKNDSSMYKDEVDPQKELPIPEQQINKAKLKLRKAFWTVRAAIRWRKVSEWNKPNEYKLAKVAQEQLKKLSNEQLSERVRVWIGMVVAKLISVLVQQQKTIDNSNFIVKYLYFSKFVQDSIQKRNKKEQDFLITSFISLTKFLFQSFEQYSSSEYFITELKLLSFLQFFSDSSAEHSVFITKRVKQIYQLLSQIRFWNKKELTRDKLAEQLVICEFIIFYNIIPSVINLDKFDERIDTTNINYQFNVKALVSLLQILFFEFFESKFEVQQFDVKHIIQKLYLISKNSNLIIEAEDVNQIKFEKEPDQPYIYNVYSVEQFKEIIDLRPKWFTELKQTFSKIVSNLHLSMIKQ